VVKSTVYQEVTDRFQYGAIVLCSDDKPSCAYKDIIQPTIIANLGFQSWQAQL
jgi:hypothetical protein